jgi:hypothetical protein
MIYFVDWFLGILLFYDNKFNIACLAISLLALGDAKVMSYWCNFGLIFTNFIW